MTLHLNKDQIKAWKLKQLESQSICPLCQLPLSSFKESNIVVDHDHDTGYIRGLLCRVCNSQEGYVNTILRKLAKSDVLDLRLGSLASAMHVIHGNNKTFGPVGSIFKYACKACGKSPRFLLKQEALAWLSRLGKYWKYHEKPRVDLMYGREDFKKEK